MIKKSLIIFGFIHDALLLPLVIIFFPISYLFKGTSKYRKNRSSIYTLFKTLKNSNQKTIAFYCASVGEFEQAIPLIDQYKSSGCRCMVFFHSKNGFDHCNSVSNLEKYLTPYDFFFVWMIIFLHTKPSLFIINRHEFWPGVLLSAYLFSKIVIINYVIKVKKSPIQRLALRLSEKVFTVNAKTVKNQKLIFSGDTRKDRLISRYFQNETETLILKRKIRNRLPISCKLIVIGNCYLEDIEVLKSIPSSIFEKFVFLIIPSRKLLAQDFSYLTYESAEIESIDWGSHDIIVWKTTGNLFEIYSSADIAWVGGGFSQGIHNCVEPHFFRIPLISGPKLNEQPDAIELKKQNHLHTFENGIQLFSLLSQMEFSMKTKPDITINTSPTAFIFNSLNENYYTR